MTYYAVIDSTQPDPKKITTWLDTEFAQYGAMPASNNLIEMTQAEWDEHMQDMNHWYVTDGKLIYQGPPAQTADQMLAAQVRALTSAGLTIKFLANPDLSGTYAVDSGTQNKITSVEAYLQKNGKFPGSAGSVMAWPDVQGTMHLFPHIDLFNAFATAIADFVADLDLYSAGAGDAPNPNVTI